MRGGGRERESKRANMCKQGRGRERGGERIPSRLYMVRVEPNMGLEPRNPEIMT